MTAEERLALVRVKVERAKKHLGDLEVAIKAFEKGDPSPYRIGVKDDPDAGKRIYYLMNNPFIPTYITAIAGDVVQNLRGTLDHLAWTLVSLTYPQGIPSNLHKRICFPIVDTAAKYPAVRGQIQSLVSQKAIEQIDRTEPYGDGKGVILWQLHSLSIADKHRFLLTVAGQYTAIDIGSAAKGAFMQMSPDMADALRNIDLTLFFGVADKTCPLKAGDPLFIDSLDHEVNKEIKFGIQVSLYEPQIIQPDPLIPTLQQMADFIDNLIVSFKPLLA